MNGWGSRFGLDKLLTPKVRTSDDLPVTPLKFSNTWCIGCSACTLTCGAVRNGSAPSWFEPKQRFLIPLTGEAVKSYPCETCGSCTAVCPVGVPLHA